MRYERIELSKENENVYLEAYIADPIKAFVRKAILILPGGGYYKISERESAPIAQAFMPYGYNAFVLHYSVGKESGKKFPDQLIEATLAIKHIKDHAEEYGIDSEELFAVGFSAGGHLAGTLGTLWKSEEVNAAVADMPCGYNKLKGVMLIYPMISPDYSNNEKYITAWESLCDCKITDKEKLHRASVERHVDADSTPAFIVHGFNDKTVDLRNSLALGNAYAEAGVPFELHVYPNAPHGFSLANAITANGKPKYELPVVAEWLRMAAEWAETL